MFVNHVLKVVLNDFLLIICAFKIKGMFYFEKKKKNLTAGNVFLLMTSVTGSLK